LDRSGGEVLAFHPSRIHTNPTQPPPKTGLGNLQQSIGLQRIKEEMDYVHWCKINLLNLFLILLK
jgi:hypothetical protein